MGHARLVGEPPQPDDRTHASCSLYRPFQPDGSASPDRCGFQQPGEQLDAGKLGAVRFANERDLVPAAGGLYVTEAVPTPAPETVIQQGMIEESNVEPIVEMTRMMNIAHNFSFAKDLGDSESDRTRSA